MSALLRQYIEAVLSEATDYRVPNQMVPRGAKKQTKKMDDMDDKDSEEAKKDMEETNVVANIVGYSASLGASSADTGIYPMKPAQKHKKNNKDFVR